MPSRKVIKKPFIGLIKTIRKYRLREFGTSGIILIPKKEIPELVLKEYLPELLESDILNKFNESNILKLKKLGYKNFKKALNKYYIKYNYKNTDYYIFSTTTKEKIDECLSKITQSEEEIKQGKKYSKLVFEEEINGKWYLKYKGKKMWVRENEMTKSIRLNICLLMFGQKTVFINENTGDKIDLFSDPVYKDYKIGSEVHAGALSDIVIVREDLIEKDFIMKDEADDSLSSRESRFRKIRDAARGINIRSREKLGIDIFRYKDQQLNVIKK